MSREPVLAYRWLIHESGFDHVPTERALKTAKNEKSRQSPNKADGQPVTKQEPCKGQKISNADKATEHTVKILEPENTFEVIQRHPKVQFLKFRRCPIGIEYRHPCRFI